MWLLFALVMTLYDIMTNDNWSLITVICQLLIKAMMLETMINKLFFPASTSPIIIS